MVVLKCVAAVKRLVINFIN